MMVNTGSKPLLEVRGLQMHFPVTEGIVINRNVGEVKAVDGIDFTVGRGETLGLVGESGCGMARHRSQTKSVVEAGLSGLTRIRTL